MDISYRTIALAGVKERVLLGRFFFPAYFALDIFIVRVNNTAVYFNNFFLKLLVY